MLPSLWFLIFVAHHIIFTCSGRKPLYLDWLSAGSAYAPNQTAYAWILGPIWLVDLSGINTIPITRRIQCKVWSKAIQKFRNLQFFMASYQNTPKVPLPIRDVIYHNFFSEIKSPTGPRFLLDFRSYCTSRVRTTKKGKMMVVCGAKHLHGFNISNAQLGSPCFQVAH